MEDNLPAMVQNMGSNSVKAQGYRRVFDQEYTIRRLNTGEHECLAQTRPALTYGPRYSFMYSTGC